MLVAFGESLARLVGQSAESLHRNSRRWRRDLGCAEWWLGLCLLAWQRRGGLSELGYRSITDYAERALQLSGRKVAALLAVARALEHLPLFSNAYRRGEICWSKVRELQTLVTPETERLWLEFALAHRADEVERTVAMSPNEWKRQRALNASLAGVPIVDALELEKWLKAPRGAPPAAWQSSVVIPPEVRSVTTMEPTQPSEAPAGAGVAGTVGCHKPDAGEEGNATSATLPGETVSCVNGAAPGNHVPSKGLPEAGPANWSGGRCAGTGLEPNDCEPVSGSTLSSGDEPANRRPLIRLQVEMTSDQFAVLESAERIARARKGRRLTRGAVLAEIAESFVMACPARTRSRYLPMVRVATGGREGWYETRRGMLPVDPKILARALEKSPTAKTTSADGGGKVIERQGAEPTAGELGKARNHGGAGREGEGSPRSRADEQTFQPVDNRSGRKKIPQATLQALYSLAGSRCQCCGSMESLTVHHKIPVSEGGSDELENLCLLCQACHRGEHEDDFAHKPHWRAAQENARRGARGGRPLDPPAEEARAP